jgi:hypothetical protein
MGGRQLGTGGTVARRGSIGLILAIVVFVTALTAPAAHAKGSLLGLSPKCGATSKPFAQFGDYRNYTFAPDGGLEAGGSGWALSGGARVVSGNEPFFVHSPYDTRSLYLPAGSTASTPPACMGTTSTFIRFFVKNSPGGSLRVQVIYRGLLGNVVATLNWATISNTTSWGPSPPILNLQSLLALLGARTVQLKFYANGAASQVDDIYVDPWASSD